MNKGGGETDGQRPGVGLNVLWEKMCEASKRMVKKNNNQLFKDHVTWFMWTTQVAILSRHVLMFVISKFYAWISVIWFVVRVEPENHLGLIQVDTRNSFKIYYCIWAAHLNLWLEKSTLLSNGSAKTDLLVVGKKCCCGLGETPFSNQPSEIVEWRKLHLFMTSDQMCCQSCKWRLVTSM